MKDGECESASSFSLTLNTGHGINVAQAHCEYTRIDRIGSTDTR